MSQPFGSFVVAVGALADVITNQYPDANTAVLINESPYTLKVNPGNGSYFVISAFTQAMIPLGNQYSGVLKVTAVADITFSGTAPVSVLYVQTYAQGEQVLGTYPASLDRQVNIGGGALSQATSVVQTGQPVPTSVVAATPSPSFLGATQEASINNDGSAHFGKILLSQNVTWDSLGNENVQSLTENGGGIKGTAPMKLISGNQETGKTGSLQYAAAGTVVGTETNFKTVMTNVPSSITITVAIQANDSSAGFADVDVNGFALLFTVVATGQGQWRGSYTTVGN